MFDWLSRLFVTEKRQSIEDPSVPLDSDAAFDILVQNPSTSGVNVNRQSVLGYPAVYRGVRLVSSSIARLPLFVFKRLPSGGQERDTNHPAYDLLRWQPSSLYHAFTFIETLVAHAMLQGNGYAWVDRNGAADPIELTILDPERTFPEKNGDMITYRTIVNEQQFRIPQADVIHIKNVGYQGIIGYSVIHLLRESLGLGLAYQRYGATFFTNNAKSNLVIELAHGLKNPDAVKRLRESIASVHSGLSNSHKPLILEEGAKATALPVNNEEAQWLQSREFDVTQVANILGLPPHKLGAKIATAFGSLESENRAFLTDSLAGWLCNIELELRQKLLRESEKERDTHFIKFDRSELERPDAITEAEIDTILANNGLRLRDDLLAKRNLPPLPDGIGQKVTMPTNIKFVGDEPEPAPPAAPPPEPAPPAAPPPEPAPPAATDDAQQQEANRQLMQHVIGRMVKRMGSHAKRAAKLPDKFTDWLDTELVLDHRHVIYDTLLPVVRVCNVTSNTTAATDRLTDALIQDIRKYLDEISGQHPPATFAKALGIALDKYEYNQEAS